MTQLYHILKASYMCEYTHKQAKGNTFTVPCIYAISELKVRFKKTN